MLPGMISCVKTIIPTVTLLHIWQKRKTAQRVNSRFGALSKAWRYTKPVNALWNASANGMDRTISTWQGGGVSGKMSFSISYLYNPEHRDIASVHNKTDKSMALPQTNYISVAELQVESLE